MSSVVTPVAQPAHGAAVAAPVTPLPTVSVVICCFTLERWDQILAAVESARRQSHRPLEVIVVVDHAPDLERRLMEDGRGARVVASRGARGLSGARNTGVEESRGDVVAFLDDDATADPWWVETLASAYAADADVLGVGGHVEPVWEEGRPAWFPPEFDWVVGCSHSGMPAGVAPVRNFVGANMSFRRSVLEEVGGFRVDLGRVGDRPLGCEETELCIRAGAGHPDGWLRYDPSVSVRHHVAARRGTWRYFVSRCWSEGLSKAAVSRLRGAASALESERRYVWSVLPRGIGSAVGSAVESRDPAALRRGGAIVVGLGTTTAGYLRARFAPEVGPAARRALITGGPWLAAMGAWALSLRSVPVDAMGDTGLVSVLPPLFWAAVVLLLVSAVLLVHRGHARDRTIAAYVAGLVVMIHATPVLLYDSLRYAWAWKHIGVVDYITTNGSVNPYSGSIFSAYHAWPGFFALNAVVVEAGGLESSLSYAAWAPPVTGLLAAALLRIIFGALVADRRQAWLGVLVFVLANWVGQDYFAPQAFAFLLHLAVLATCLRYLSAQPVERSALPWWRRWANGPLPGVGTRTLPERRRVMMAVVRQRRVMVVVVLLLMLAIVSSHQLTPFMLMAALLPLTVGRVVRPGWLVPALVAITVIWVAVMAMGFLQQNLYWIVASIGQPAETTQTTFVDMSNATAGQKLVNWADRALTAGLGVLALGGGLRLLWRRVPVRVLALLAVSPMPLLAANSYGGEMLFRVFLFASPFLALLAAGLVYPRVSTRWAAVVLPVVLTLGLLVPFSLAYYGKERMNHFTDQEVQASAWLYGNAPAGSLVLAATANFPWAYSHAEDYQYLFLDGQPAPRRAALGARPLEVLAETMGSVRPAFVVLTRSQDVAVRYSGALPNGSFDRLEDALGTDTEARVLFRNGDATIWRIDGQVRP